MSSSRRGLTVGLLLCVMAVAFEAMAVVTAMPAAAADLGDLHLYAWAFTAVMIPQMVAIVLAGRLCDRIGPTRPLLVGLGIFAAGIIVAALAPSMAVLLAGRAIQGLGGGAVNLSLMVLTAVAYDPRERARIMTWYSACWMLPSFVGPAVAAWVSETFSWHWVFWSVLPMVAIGLAFMAPTLARLSPGASASEGRSTPPAVPNHAALGVAAGLALLQWAGQRLEAWSLLWAVAAVVLLVVFFPRLMPQGFTPVAPGLSATVMVRGLMAGGFFGMQTFLPLMLTARGASLMAAGAVITVGSVGWMTGSWLQARPWLRLSRDQIIFAGSCGLTLGLVVIAVSAWSGSGSLILPAVGSVFAGLGMGLQSASTSLVTMQLSSEADIGRNTSSLQVGETSGNAVFAGMAGTLFAALGGRGPDAVTFGAVMTAMAVVAALGAVSARRIGHVRNFSLRSSS
ncbi:MAG: MFS transporter [Propioniciclava sp.]|uniref:MFS transporter n=1 Tax=Propioniciclava sp. TaxID=2038686 RepID=UPI0039E4EF2A